ncbi:MAG: O-antigen ligase family protein, partial [Gemmataceae bacterium]
MAYWSIPLTVQPFGPFICRNHYPFYLNVCIALAMGLTLSIFRGKEELKQASRIKRRSSDRSRRNLLDLSGWLDSLIELLQKPGLLWLVISLGFMISSVFFSLSRGGVACLLLTSVLYFLFLMSQSQEIGRWQLGFLAGSVAFLILFWFGFNIFESRLKTLWTGDGLEDSRWSIWADAFRIFKDFPLVGTGFGTYFFVELVHRTETGIKADMLAEFVHNDYLETLVEGGLVGMGLLLFILFAVYRASWNALQHFRRRSISGVIIGGIFAITAIALHSFVDFGMRIPAIAVLVTVLAAYLSALGSGGKSSGTTAGTETVEKTPHSSAKPGISSPDSISEPNEETISNSSLQSDDEPELPRFRSFPVCITLPLALLVGGILVIESLRSARGEFLEKQGSEWLVARSGDIQGQKDRLEKLEQALKVLPDDAIRQLKTSQAYLDLYRSEVDEWDASEIALEAGSLLFEGYVPSGKPICPLPLAGKLIQREILGRKGATNSDPRWSTLREYLSQGMTHALAARNLAPTLGKPHLLIAANRDLLRSGDTRETYLARAKKVMPSSTELWYRAGVVEWQNQNRKEACTSWKRSLELSGEFLPDILGMIGG